MTQSVQSNPLRTRADMIRAAVSMLTPLIPRMSPGRALIHAGDTGAVYPEAIARMEAFARPLWAIVPMLAGKCPEAEPLWALWREGLMHGVDPSHPEYWGKIGPFDQRMVEMAVMGVGLCIVPERFLGDLPERSRGQLVAWLSQINEHDMPTNNWVFFRILVNAGLMLNGYPHDARRLADDFAHVEAHYEADGWYFDYETQRDYYTPMGYHYYGLLYAHVMQARDPERAALFLDRATRFAPQHAAYFTNAGDALPYGRSLTYRFAQGAFWAALAFADAATPALDYGAMKALLLGNLRGWLARPIFTADGLLTIGYGYPNLSVAEGYNAPGSPYWGMKAFLALALPEDHPFWTAEETPPSPPARLPLPHAGLLVTRDVDGRHVQAFAAGNHAPNQEHTDAKYEKFAYSTAFGFSVSRGAYSLEQGAFDSMLALSGDGVRWHVRYGCRSHAIEPDRVVSVWEPLEGVTVRTQVIPLGAWHVRVHDIRTPRPLKIAEGGYALAREGGGVLAESAIEGLHASVSLGGMISGIIGYTGYQEAVIIQPSANTNLLYARTLLPTLRGEIPSGETRLLCAVQGAVGGARDKPPTKEELYASLG